MFVIISLIAFAPEPYNVYPQSVEVAEDQQFNYSRSRKIAISRKFSAHALATVDP